MSPTTAIHPPFWCPWCKVVVSGESGYDHAYNHQDKGPYAVDVERLLAEHQTEAVYKTLPDDTLDTLEVCRYCYKKYKSCECPEREEIQ